VDIKHPRPRQGFFAPAQPVVSQQPVSYSSANSSMPIASSLPAYVEAQAGFAEPDAIPKPINRKNDFSSSAKAYKRHILAKKIYHGLAITTVILVIISFVIAGLGIYLNMKYTNRALPFAKIGGLSVGGMDKQQINALLDKTSKNLTVTFVDGGLTWTTPASTFNPQYDFESAIDQSIAKRVNPYSFLIKTQIPVESMANERHVEGYLRQNITHMQTRSEDAYIMKGTDSVVAKPEVVGFSASPAHVTQQINNALSEMSDVSIKMNSVAVKPNIYVADLQPEINQANNMLATNVSVRYVGINATPTKKQKLDWLTITQVPGSNAYSYDFSKTKIRDYVVGLAQKYQRPVTVTEPDNKENPKGYSVPTVVINNVEDVTSQIYQGLKSSTSVVAVFSRDNSIKRSIPVASENTKTQYQPTNPVSQASTNTNNSQPTTPVQRL